MRSSKRFSFLTFRVECGTIISGGCMRNLEGLLATLKLMEETEILIAEFYEACGDKWKEDSQFWLSLAAEERRHAEYIRKITEMIKGRMEKFEFYRPFNPAAIKTVNRGLIENRDKVRRGEISKKNAFAIAYDIERSLLESRYPEIVRTEDIEYNTFMAQVMKETRDHMKRIEEMLNKG